MGVFRVSGIERAHLDFSISKYSSPSGTTPLLPELLLGFTTIEEERIGEEHPYTYLLLTPSFIRKGEDI